ncbi:MAG: ABC1 kinase family protein [Phycisphaeraceae bacterium]
MPIHNPITSRIRNTKRLAQVITVLARHGFADVVERIGVLAIIDKGLELIGKPADHPHQPLPVEERMRHVLEELGPTFIKLGQILSTRPDLVGQDLADEFAKLQSDSPRVPYAQIKARLEEEFGGPELLAERFADIDETPLAAASMAQVHGAKLVDGTAVVLKVLRPGIKDTMDADMEVMNALAEFAETHFAEQGYSPTAVVREFKNELAKETDLLHEAKSTRRLYRLFKDDDNIHFPKVFLDYSTHKVLCIERIEGRLLSRTDVTTLDAQTRRNIVANGSEAVFRMCLKHGFFHADPHPGNLFILEGGAICFIDCGMTGHVEARTSEHLADLIKSVIDGNLDRAIRATLSLAGADPVLETDRAFRLDAWEFISRFQVDDLAELDLGHMLGDFFELLRRWTIQCPADLVFLIKAITTIQGVGVRVDPDFDLIAQVRPYVERLVKQQYSLRAAKRRLLRSAGSYVELIEDIPSEVRIMFAHLKRKDFTVSLEHKGLDRLTSTIEHASRNLSLALIFASLLLTSAILFAADNEASRFGYLSIIGLVAMVGCAGFGLFMLLSIYRKQK